MMDNTPLVSIIVPIYKAEKYLSRCIESVLGQSYQNVELILVNDCTPDHSMIVAQNYAKQDRRVKIIEHEKNLGTMRARDNGVRASHGDWITFLDSDDWLPYDAISNYIKATVDDNVDVVVGILHRVDEEGKVITEEVYTLPFGDSKEGIIRALFSDNMSHTLCGKIFSKHIFKDPLVIEDNNTNGEDAFVFYQIVDRFNRMTTIPQLTYNYLQGSSATPRGKKMSVQQIRNTASFWTYLHTDFLVKHPEYKEDVELRTFRILLANFKEGYNKSYLFNLISYKVDFGSIYTNHYIRTHTTSSKERVIDTLLFNSQVFRWIVSKIH